MPSTDVKVTYYLEVMSSWCHWVEPVWSQLKARHPQGVEFTWKIARMSPADFPSSREQCEWFYARSGTIMRSPYRLNSGWLEPDRRGDYAAPNLVAEAGRDFGVVGDTIRLALNHAAVLEGRRIGDLGEAVAVAARAARIGPAKLRRRAESAAVRARVEASTAEFTSHRIGQRPAFILENAIGDKAVFSGLVRLEPLAATIDAMLADAATYASHAAHHGTPPAA